MMRQAIVMAVATVSVGLHHLPPYQTGSPQVYRMTLSNIHDMQYYGTLVVGGQSMNSILDTGSIELVVMSKECHTACGQEERLFIPQSSAEYLAGQISMMFSYGSGQVLGREAYDSVNLGPFTGEQVPFWEAIDAQMPLLQDSAFSAIIGLGPIPQGVKALKPGGADNSHGYALVLESLGLAKSRYSVCLGSEPKSPGYLTWNEAYLDEIPNAFKAVPVTSKSHWMAELTDVRFGDQPLDCQEQTCGAIVDSGTSLLSAPLETRDALASLVSAATGGTCGGVQDLPDLKFKLGGMDFSLPPESYLGNINGKPPPGMEAVFQTQSDNLCQVAVMTVNMKSILGRTWVLGMPFFRKYYTVFQQRTASQPPIMHMALAGDSCNPAQPGLIGSLESDGRRALVRTIYAAKLTMPAWIHSAHRAGKLDETGSSFRVLRSTQLDMLHWNHTNHTM